jgi:DNA-binding MarR family transcriptional regulator
LEQILEKKTGGRSVDIAYREYGYRMNEIARHRGVHYATVSRRLKALESESE